MNHEDRITQLRQLMESGRLLEVIIRDEISDTLLVDISQLGSIKALEISLGNVTSIPIEIGLLTNIKELTISGKSITALPAEIGLLLNLVTLRIKDTSITNLPAEIGNLNNLRGLDLSNNVLSSLPDEIFGLSNLGYLFLSGNNLNDISKKIGNLSNLGVLAIEGNPLKSLPEEIGVLTNLYRLDFESKQLINLGEDIDRIFKLKFRNPSDKPFKLSLSPDSIESEAFKNDKSLKKITIPEGITRLDREVFKGCSSLEKVVLPDSLNWIRLRAFENCYSLKEVTFSGNDHWVEIAPGAFKGCKSLKTMSLPYGITAIHKETFKDCASLEEIFIPDSVVLIEENAFENCRSLRKISLPWIMEKLDRTILSGNCPADEVNYIRNPDYRLEGNLLVSKDGHELIKFYYAVERDFIVPEKITKIADCAFRNYYFDHSPQGNYSATHSILPYIPDKKLNKLTIPSHVENISHDAFLFMCEVEHVQIDEKLVEKNFRFFCEGLKRFVVINKDGKVKGVFDLSYEKNKETIESPEGYDQWINDKLYKEVDPGFNDLKLKIALNRLNFPYALSETSKEVYVDYLKKHKKVIVPELIEKSDFETLTKFADVLITKGSIDEYIEQANVANNTQASAFLMDYKNKTFGIDVITSKKFDIKVSKVLVPGSQEYIKKYFSFTGFKEGRLTVQGYKGPDTTITLPTDLNGVPVIGFNPRKSFGVAEEIIIPEGYTEINSQVDNRYHLWKYEYPGNLKKLTIADSVTYLQSCVFAKIHTLEEVRVGKGITALNHWLFAGCENLARLILPVTIVELNILPCTGKDSYLGVTYWENIGNFCIHAPKGSYAIEYAKKHDIKYVEI